MFGFSFGEMVVLIIVGIIVVGPRRLPAMMRTAGSWISKLRRMTTELRTQSGIDDLIRQEGLEREIRELRALSRVNVIETLVTPVIGAASGGSVVAATPRVRPPEPEPAPAPAPLVQPLREREYPVLGCDAYGADVSAAPEPAAAEGAGAAAAPAATAADTTDAATTAATTVTTAATVAARAATTAAAAATAPADTTDTAAATAATAAGTTDTAAGAAAAPQGAAENGAAS